MRPESMLPPLPRHFVQVALEDLPRHSPWPARLLGLDNFAERTRDGALVTQEYAAKWSKVAKDLADLPQDLPLAQAIARLRDQHFPERFLVHAGERIYSTPTNADFWTFNNAFLRTVLTTFGAGKAPIMELGCGWGRNLFTFLAEGLCTRVIGGEYTPEGVQLARDIAQRHALDATFEQFDYCNPSEAFLQHAKGAVVFTHNSIEQVPTLPMTFVERLAAAQPLAVIHFEPVSEYAQDGESLVHLMWRRYTQLNDYNRNLRALLLEAQQQGVVKLVHEAPWIFGLNAFNPCSLLIWTPASRG